MPRGDPDVIFYYNHGLLATAYGIAVLGALSGIGIMEQRRISQQAVNRRLLQVMAAVSFGGCSLWGMHVMCTLAIRLKNPLTLEDYPVEIVPGYALAAFVVPVVFIIIAIELASRDKFFGKSVKERVALMADEMKRLSVAKMRMGGRQLVMLRALLASPWYLVAGGLVMGVGVFSMQYLIILGMKVNCERLYRVPHVLLAAVVSLLVCVLFLWTLFRLLTWKPKLEWLRVASAFVFGGVALSIHFVTVKSMDWMVWVGGQAEIAVREDRREIAEVVIPLVFIWSVVSFNMIIWDLRLSVIHFKTDVDKVLKSLRPLLLDARDRGLLSLDGAPAADNIRSRSPTSGGRLPKTDVMVMENLLLGAAQVLAGYAVDSEEKSMLRDSSASKNTRSPTGASMARAGSQAARHFPSRQGTVRSIAESSVADNSQAPLFSGGNKPLSQTGQATAGSSSSSSPLGSTLSSTFGRLTGGGRSKVAPTSPASSPPPGDVHVVQVSPISKASV